jgi:hypothetical protein
MKPLSWRRTAMWTAMPLMFLALMAGPALAGGVTVSSGVGLVLYEVTEDMFLLNRDGQPVQSLAQAAHRSAVAQLSGYAKLGTPLCPWEVLMLTPGATSCTVNASGADHLSLADGKGTLGGTFAVVVQGDNKSDAREFVVMTGSFVGDADLSLPFANVAPIGFLTRGRGCIDGYPCDLEKAPLFTFTGTFRLPFALDKKGKPKAPGKTQAYYLADDFSTFLWVEPNERSLGEPTVRIEIKF